jgi:uncharacterized membrane-anchored protein
MLKGKRWIIWLNFLLFSGFMTYSITRNEKTLAEGQPVFLELAPQDPRSLMQGDYMQLAYRMADISLDSLRSLPSTGFCVIRLDDRNIGQLLRFQSNRKPNKIGEILIPFHNNHQRLSIGAESYFFQEGNADKYEMAKYGMLMVSNDGNSLLSALCDSTLRPLK